MKFSILIFTLLSVAFASALPTWKEDVEIAEEDQWEPADPQPLIEHHFRLKRATCDLFSFQSQWVTPNHTFCAAHCIAKGNRGGQCKGTICHCRK